MRGAWPHHRLARNLIACSAAAVCSCADAVAAPLTFLYVGGIAMHQVPQGVPLLLHQACAACAEPCPSVSALCCPRRRLHAQRAPDFCWLYACLSFSLQPKTNPLTVVPRLIPTPLAFGQCWSVLLVGVYSAFSARRRACLRTHTRTHMCTRLLTWPMLRVCLCLHAAAARGA